MQQLFVPFGKFVAVSVVAGIGFNFATPALAQAQGQQLGERVPIDLSVEEGGEEGEAGEPINAGPPEKIDLLAERQKAVSAQEALESADDAYGPRKPRPCPKSSDPNEIIVCAAPQDDSEFRVLSSGELDPNHANNRDGIPSAADIPGIAGPGIFTGPATVGGLCTPGSCPPPMPIMIDLKEIPEAPAGSDADLVAKGEKRLD